MLYFYLKTFLFVVIIFSAHGFQSQSSRVVVSSEGVLRRRSPRERTIHHSRIVNKRCSSTLFAAPAYKNFDDMLSNEAKPILVDFYALWCGPCQMMQPVLEDVAGRLEGKALVAKVDTDKSPRLANKYQIEALPTLILFHKGQIVEKFMGYMTADELEGQVTKVMKRIGA